MGVCCGSIKDVKSNKIKKEYVNDSNVSSRNTDDSKFDLIVNLSDKSQVYYISSKKMKNLLISDSKNSNIAFMDSSDYILIQNTSNCQILMGPSRK